MGAKELLGQPYRWRRRLPRRQGSRALRPLLVLQSFVPARGRAASLDGCALPPLRKLPITGGLGADRRKPALGPSRGLGDASGALIRFHGDGLAGRLGVALVAPSASHWPSETPSRHACDYIKLPRRRQKARDSVAGSPLCAGHTH